MKISLDNVLEKVFSSWAAKKQTGGFFRAIARKVAPELIGLVGKIFGDGKNKKIMKRKKRR